MAVPVASGAAPAPRDASAVRSLTIVAHHVGPVGGMERVLSELALGLSARGYDVTVIAYECELPAGAGVTFRRVRGPSRPFVLSYPWFMLAGTLAVRRWRRGLVMAVGAVVLGEVDLIAIHYCQQVGPATPSRSNLLFRLNVAASAQLGKLAERVCFRLNRPQRPRTRRRSPTASTRMRSRRTRAAARRRSCAPSSASAASGSSRSSSAASGSARVSNRRSKHSR